MKFAPLGNPLKSKQMHFKKASFGEGTKSFAAINSTHTFTMGKWFNHSCFEYTQPIYGEPRWLLSSRAVHIFIIDLISRGFDFVSRKFK